MNPLVELQKFGQSIWYDNIRRAMIETGDFQQKIASDDLRGVTSNPAIFEKAITGSSDYNTAMQKLIAEGKSVQDIFEVLAVEDVGHACDLFLPVYEKTGGVDGYVSLEVSPLLANNTADTIAEARRLWAALGRKNAMIKVPATPEGIPAIRALIADGLNINVTLIFSREAYAQVMEAYISGLEDRAAAGKPIDHISSVASFFVSRVDTLIDSQLEFKIRRSTDEAEKAKLTSLLGKAAIANAKLAYQDFKQTFSAERFAGLRAKGARVQRPLWASTGTKNPQYSDVLYVETLIGSDTVNTVPPATYTAYRDHGSPKQTIEDNLAEAQAVFGQLADAGIDLKQVTKQLLDEGVKQFEDAFKSLMASITSKQAILISGILDRQTASLGSYAEAVQATVKTADKDQWIRRIWRKDAALWKADEEHQKIIKNALGWVTVTDIVQEAADELAAFSQRIVKDGFTHVMLLGMGGSSLCPEVFRRTFGKQKGYPELHVLDSTDPATVSAFEKSVDLTKTLFIVASKSGSTTEPLMFYKYFFNRLRELKGDKAGENFAAITDPGTLMEQMASGDKFRRIFLNPADIGGRYSALSFFGSVPAALQGFDFKTLIDRADRAMHACAPPVPTEDNPAVRLGGIIGTLANQGRDKLTLIISPEIASLGLWIEQLIAESTGKEGKGIIPIAGESLNVPTAYGNDRLFVSISVGAPDTDTDSKLRALEAAGHPVVRRTLKDTLDLGEEFYIWEMSTAIAGAVLGINSFDQPNVQESKDNTKALLEEFKEKGALPAQKLAAEGSGLKVLCDEATLKEIGSGHTPEEFITAHLSRVKAGDYVALLNYIQETDAHESSIQAIRMHISEAFKVATTTGYGPRFLHSTGQLHKGGAASGVFIQITADDVSDVPLPGEVFTFGILKQAQALGDFQSLSSRHRRAIRLHLGSDMAGGLKKLLTVVQQSFPIGRSKGQ
jgi:transaldolase/glucose-6-phosphate isomerase